MYGKTSPAVHGQLLMKSKVNPYAERFAVEKGSAVETYLDLSIVCYQIEGVPYLAVWAGQQARPKYHYRFSQMGGDKMREAKRISIQNERTSALNNKEDQKRQWELNRKQGTEQINIGDIFVSSWGYEQTNVDFVQVVGKSGVSVSVRPLAQNRTPYSLNTGTTMPVKDQFLGSAQTIRVISRESLARNSYSSYCLWNSKPQEYSSDR